MKQANYDDIAEDYKSLEKGEPMKEGVINHWMLKGCGDLKGKRVLDLGCGSGFSSRSYAKAGAKEVVGVDVSKRELEIAKKEEEENPLNIKYFLGDLKNFDYSDLGVFDMITAEVSLHYAENSKELEKFISLPSPNLKSGGKFVASIIHTENIEGSYPTEKKVLDKIQDSDGKRVRVALQGVSGEKIVEFINIAYPRRVYEEIFKKNGYGEVDWFDMVPPNETIKKFPEMDWAKNIAVPTLIMISAVKK